MWRRLRLIGLVLAAEAALAAAPAPLGGVHRVVLLGDSITQAGMYLDDVVAAVRLSSPNSSVEFLNLGLAAETVAGMTEAGFAAGEFPRPDLHERLERILAQTKPDLIVACYGMNDGLYAPYSAENFRRFCAGMEFLHRAAAAAGAAIVHLTPPIFDPLPVSAHVLPAGRTGYSYGTPYADYDRDVLQKYADWLIGQRRSGWEVQDVHAAMLGYLAAARGREPRFSFSKDGVHPNALGHAVIARSLLQYWGLPARFAELPLKFVQEPRWAGPLALVSRKNGLLHEAWLTAIGSSRPRMPAGLPVAEASARAGALDPRIGDALAAAEASPPTRTWGGAAIRSSVYVTVRDGTRLALDLYRPADWSGPLPVILRATPYHRSINADGSSRNLYFALLQHGYAVASLDLRGHGASFGKIYGGGFGGDPDRLDLYDVIEWIAAQPWCTGSLGMAGGSYEGLSQFWAASAMPPHLKAIAPSAAPLDWYGSYRVNGVLQEGASRGWDQVVREDDLVHLAPAVDADPGRVLLAAAVAEHRLTWDSGVAGATPTRLLPFRDSAAPPGGFAYGLSNWWNFAANFRVSQIPVLQFGGWSDKFLDQTFALYRTLAEAGVQQRLVVGPWYHTAWYRSRLADINGEHLRWFDRWVKGIPDAAPSEPPVRYFVRGSEAGQEWHEAAQWPLPTQHRLVWYLGNGSLVKRPEGLAGADVCPADDAFTTAHLLSRWNYADKGPKTPEFGLQPVKMDDLDRLGAAYTTEPLAADTEITGFPVLSFWISSPANADLFAFLEEVDEQGHATLLTDGAIRLADRATGPAPFNNESLPWHPCLSGMNSPPQSGHDPIRAEWSLFPLSNLIRRGHRLRLLLSAHDGAGWDRPPVTATGPRITLLHEAGHPSAISIPVAGP